MTLPQKLSVLLYDYGFERRCVDSPYQCNGFYIDVHDDGYIDCYKKVFKHGFTTENDKLKPHDFNDTEGLWNFKVINEFTLTDYEITELDKHMEGMGLTSKSKGKTPQLKFVGWIKPKFVAPKPVTLSLFQN